MINKDLHSKIGQKPPAPDDRAQREILNRWLKFIIGLTLLTLMVLFFASGITPPGVCGEVLRHNQQNNIDASPIWYMGVEKMQQYEKAVQK